MNNSILGTGLSGLVGSRVVELLEEHYKFEDLSLETGIDITKSSDLDDPFRTSNAKVVLHLAAKADVDSCEDDRLMREDGQAWRVNVIGTQNIVNLAKKTGKKVIYISTDFVFDGTKQHYTEKDKPNPSNWYGYTKYLGENIVKDSGLSFCIVRISYPYRAVFVKKKDFVRATISRIKDSGEVFGLVDHIFTPTFIDDIAYALDKIIKRNAQGIFHVVGSQSLTPYRAVEEIVKVYDLNATIKPIKREIYFKHGAFRPFKLSLKNDKIKNLGVNMKRFHEGLTEMKSQLKDVEGSD